MSGCGLLGTPVVNKLLSMKNEGTHWFLPEMSGLDLGELKK